MEWHATRTTYKIQLRSKYRKVYVLSDIFPLKLWNIFKGILSCKCWMIAETRTRFINKKQCFIIKEPQIYLSYIHSCFIYPSVPMASPKFINKVMDLWWLRSGGFRQVLGRCSGFLLRHFSFVTLPSCSPNTTTTLLWRWTEIQDGLVVSATTLFYLLLDKLIYGR